MLGRTGGFERRLRLKKIVISVVVGGGFRGWGDVGRGGDVVQKGGEEGLSIGADYQSRREGLLGEEGREQLGGQKWEAGERRGRCHC